MFYYFLITSLICSRLRLSLLLFVTLVYYLFKVSIGSLSVCYATAQFEASIVSSSVTSLWAYSLFKILIVSLSVCYFTALL